MHQYELMKNSMNTSPEASAVDFCKFGIAQAYKFMKAKKYMLNCIISNDLGPSNKINSKNYEIEGLLLPN